VKGLRRHRPIAPLAVAAATTAAVLASAGCFVRSSTGGGETLVEVGVPGLGRVASAISSSDPWDSQGIFHLELFPKLVRVAAVSSDYELASGTWPDPVVGIGEEGEGASGEVSVSLDVPAGSSRKLRALGFVVDAGKVLVYMESEAKTLDLIAGQDAQTTLEMTRARSGTVAASAACDLDGTGWTPAKVALVDARALVLHTAQTLVKTDAGTLAVEIRGVPVDRPHFARITLASSSGKTKDYDIRKPTFSVPGANDRISVALSVPCSVPY
jgi:hypothetical protein